jgi:type II secretory pathway pseudopilin PulG
MVDMQRPNERGFTIMELLVAIAFLGVVIVSLMNLFTGIRQINRAANNYTIAVQVAQQLLEKYRNTAYGSITIPSGNTVTTDMTTASLGAYPSLLAPRSDTTTVTYVNSSNTTVAADIGFKRVDVGVSYTDRTGVRQVQFSTIIANRGLNR